MSITTIWSILNNNIEDLSIKRGIEIPMIQRDYAQGRKNDKANEIRKVFINNLRRGIEGVLNGSEEPMELDFIYGYVDTEVFIPLDGQQRLTTLYLLHWYLAFKQGILSHYHKLFSKFSYQTRQSSADFLKQLNNGLNEKDHCEIFENNRSFESVITDKNWYFVSWRYDLTIQSAITMLDEIHQAFNPSSISFENIIDEEKPCIVFNFLDIRDFGLSDDLYIKMNARGKPLTNFENLKAELGKFIETSGFNENYHYALNHMEGEKAVNVETYFVTKIDTDWTNYFWEYRNRQTNEFDDMLLNLLAFVSLNETAVHDYTAFDTKLKELDKHGSELSYYKFNSLDLLSESAIITYIDVLDLLVSNDGLATDYFNDESKLNKTAIIDAAFEENFKARYPQRILFYALFKFLIANSGTFDRVQLSKWDRLISNLVSNTIYNTPRDFHDSLQAINELIQNYSGDIYSTFLKSNITGFDTQQIKEEKLKILLLQSTEDWRALIVEAETHEYLNGQIMFILAFSGIYTQYLSVDEQLNPEAFYQSARQYFNKFKGMFQASGLKQFENELFRRALLAKGFYLIYSGNFSLIIDNDRDISWKRILKETGNQSQTQYDQARSCLKMLFDEVDENEIEGSLKQIIKTHQATDWQKDMIEYPLLMKLSYRKYVKFLHNGNVYILRTSRYNKYADPEMRSLLLKEALIKKGFAEDDIELSYIENLNQYGITRIKRLKPQVVFNHDENKKYLFKQKGKENYETSSRTKMVNFIVEHFL